MFLFLLVWFDETRGFLWSRLSGQGSAPREISLDIMREVSSDDHLEGEEEEKRLNAVEASVDEVSHEQVIGVRHISANLDEKQMWASLLFPVRKTIPSYLEEFSKVVKLAVDVSAHSHWRVNPLHVALFHWNQMCLLIQEGVFDDSTGWFF